MIRTPLFYSSVSSLCIIVRGSHLYPQNDNVHGLLHFCIIYPWPLLQAILISRALPFLFAECAKLLSPYRHRRHILTSSLWPRRGSSTSSFISIPWYYSSHVFERRLYPHFESLPCSTLQLPLVILRIEHGTFEMVR